MKYRVATACRPSAPTRYGFVESRPGRFSADNHQLKLFPYDKALDEKSKPPIQCNSRIYKIIRIDVKKRTYFCKHGYRLGNQRSPFQAIFDDQTASSFAVSEIRRSHVGLLPTTRFAHTSCMPIICVGSGPMQKTTGGRHGRALLSGPQATKSKRLSPAF